MNKNLRVETSLNMATKYIIQNKKFISQRVIRDRNITRREKNVLFLIYLFIHIRGKELQQKEEKKIKNIQGSRLERA